MTTDLSIFQLILGASLIVKLVMLTLVVASLASWTMIFSKMKLLKNARKQADKFDEEIIKLTMYDEIKGPKATVDMKKVWTVNRVTGVFTKEIYTKIPGRDTSWSSANTYRYDCRKAKKKF